MDISLHLLLVVALLTPMIVVVLAEATLRRRLRSFRVFQLFVLASGLLLIPANIVSVQAPVPSTFHVSVMAGSFAALAAQALLSALLRLPVERAQQRPGEAYRGASFMRLTDCTVLGLPDTRLSRQENEMVAAIEGKMRALNPDVIFTHSGNDQHQDHSAVHWATMRAGRRHQAILCYESPSVTRDLVPQIFVDIDDYVDAKSAAVGIHHDQADKPYTSPDSLAGIAAFRGAQAKMTQAEGFEAVRIPAFQGVL